ncbi:hypothetical protein ACWFR5_04200 [Streptomyces sp. NPDC055092]
MHPARCVRGDGTRSTIGWLDHARLDTAALASGGRRPPRSQGRHRFEAVRDVMNTALAAVLNGLDHVVTR